MPKGFSIALTRDDVTQQLRRAVGKLKSPQPPMRAIGVGLATLWRSIRVQSVLPKSVIIGSDKPHAAIHHLGGKSEWGRLTQTMRA